MTRIEQVKAALAQGPCVSKVLADRMGVSYASFGGFLAYHVSVGSIVQLGVFSQALTAGYGDVVLEARKLGSFTRNDAPVYALVGTPLWPAEPERAPSSHHKPNVSSVPSNGRSKAGPIVVGRRMMQHWGSGG